MNRTPSAAVGGPPSAGAAGWSSVAQGLLLFVPLVVLGAAVEWPASLDDPASVALPRLLENELGAGIRRLVVGFAVASAAARSLGIVRWLGPMPELASSYSTATDDGQRYAIERTYEALNSYGGTIGEVLGVGLFAAIAIGLLSAGLLRSRQVPRWIGVGAVVSAVALAVNGVELFAIDLGALLTVTVTVVQLWFLAAGAWLLVRGGRVTAGG